MRDEMSYARYNFVIVTLDRHAAGPAARVAPGWRWISQD